MWRNSLSCGGGGRPTQPASPGARRCRPPERTPRSTGRPAPHDGPAHLPPPARPFSPHGPAPRAPPASPAPGRGAQRRRLLPSPRRCAAPGRRLAAGRQRAGRRRAGLGRGAGGPRPLPSSPVRSGGAAAARRDSLRGEVVGKSGAEGRAEAGRAGWRSAAGAHGFALQRHCGETC